MLLAKPETTERLEVYDEQGCTVGSVTMPSDPELFGPEKGTVFLNRQPPVESRSHNPAQAA